MKFKRKVIFTELIIFINKISEHKDVDAEGVVLGTTTKSVKTSVLLMKAAVALQEAMTRIEQLEADVAFLKGGQQ